MTYCLGIINREGVIGFADTRITSGTETTTAKKIYSHKRKKHSYFIMTSGLRSVRDKAITYFKEVVNSDDKKFTKLYQAVNKFGEQVKRVSKEDRSSLAESGMSFNLQAIVGGQLEDDASPKLYLLYPQGNWIEVGPGTPFVIIGNSGFGTPILKRSLTYDSSLEFAMKSAFLSFDATRISANDVDYPIDTVVLKNGDYNLVENRFDSKELTNISEFWDSRLTDAINKLPAETLNRALNTSKGENLKVV